MSSNEHPAIRLYRALTDRGLTLSADGDQLLVVPAGSISPSEMADIRARKANLLTLVAHPPIPGTRPSVYGCPVFGCGVLIPWGERGACARCTRQRTDGRGQEALT
jgi:hypothetical protein